MAKKLAYLNCKYEIHLADGTMIYVKGSIGKFNNYISAADVIMINGEVKENKKQIFIPYTNIKYYEIK